MNQLLKAAAVVIGVAALVTTGQSAGAFDKAEYAARRSRVLGLGLADSETTGAQRRHH